jgi:indolepyruvate ferredoxin oxidoreductase beta subunit
MNVILLGTIIKLMGLEEIDWKKIIKDNVKEKFVDLNQKAVKVGMNLV